MMKWTRTIGYNGYGEINEVFINFTDDAMTSERAATWLTYYYPELTDDIDERLCQDYQDQGELAALLALKGFIIDIGACANGRNPTEIDIPQLCGALDLYIERFLDIDQDVPYAGELQGTYWVFDDTQHMFVKAETLKSIRGLFHIREVHIAPAVIEDDSGAEEELSQLFSIYLDMVFIPRDRTKKNIRLMVPIETCLQLTSLREAWYKVNPGK
jgi:hypothetical protein